MKKPMIMLAALLAFAAPAAAQEEPTPGEVQAGRELLEASRTRENFIRALEMGLEQGAGTDELTPAVRQALTNFMNEHFRYEDLEPDFVRMYTELFTEEEMRGMAAFYRTPLGQRMVEMLPELTVRSQAIVNDRLQAAMPELMETIMEAMEEGEGETPGSSDSR